MRMKVPKLLIALIVKKTQTKLSQISRMTDSKEKLVELVPVSDFIQIKAIEEEDTIRGVHIPAAAQDRPYKGLVIAAGNGFKDKTIQVKKGDMILYRKSAGIPIQLNQNEDYLIIRSHEVIGILKEKK